MFDFLSVMLGVGIAFFVSGLIAKDKLTTVAYIVTSMAILYSLWIIK